MVKVELHFRNGRCPSQIVWADVKFGDFVSILSESQSVNNQFKVKDIIF